MQAVWQWPFTPVRLIVLHMIIFVSRYRKSSTDFQGQQTFKYKRKYRISFSASDKMLQLEHDTLLSAENLLTCVTTSPHQQAHVHQETQRHGTTPVLPRRRVHQSTERSFATTAERPLPLLGQFSSYTTLKTAKQATKGNTTSCKCHRSGGVRSVTSTRSTTPEKVALRAIRGGEPLASAGTLMASEWCR